MMWRLYVAVVPLLWLYLVSITCGSTNDTVVDSSETLGQSINITSAETASTTGHLQHGLINNSSATANATAPPVAGATMVAATSAMRVSDMAPHNTDSPAKTSPHDAADAAATRTTPQTLHTSSTSLRTTKSNDSIILATVTDASDNELADLPSVLPTVVVGDGGISFISKDYLSTVGGTTHATASDATTTGKAAATAETTTHSQLRPLPQGIAYPPYIDQSPKNKTVEFGDQVRLRCNVNVPPGFPLDLDLDIWWEFNNIAIGNLSFWAIKKKPWSSALKIRGASLEHAGMYRCLARTPYGTLQSAPGYLVVEIRPYVVQGPGDHRVSYGTILNLSCKVEAYPPPEIAWFKNREPLQEWTNHMAITINVTQTANYSCLFRNVVGGQDFLASKYGQVTVVGIRPSYCARYNGAICRSQLAGTGHLFVDGNEEEPQALDRQLTAIFSGPNLTARSPTCQEGLRELLCHGTHPNCMARNGRLVSQPICRKDCQIVQDSCENWAQLANSNFDELAGRIRALGLTSCQHLPTYSCTSLWELVPSTGQETTPARTTHSMFGSTTPVVRVTQRQPSEIDSVPIENGAPSTTFLILVVTIPTAVSLVLLVCMVALGVRRYKYNSQFNLPKDIDLSGMKDNPMYGKSFDISFNPRLAYLEYNRNTVVYEKDIGEGAFGRVFKAQAPKLVEGEVETCVAVKVLKSSADRVVTEYFNREAQMIARFRHQNIIKLLGVCFVGRPLCLLLEYMSEGDLEDFLHSRCPGSKTSGSGLKTYQKLNIAKQIACGMAYLNERRYVHRDIATRNCLINDAMDVKISDFGLARFLGPKDSFLGHKEEHIPIRWTAPEALWDYRFTFASDIWSFGVLLWELFSYAEQPYSNFSHEDVFLHTRQGFRLEVPADTPRKVHQIMAHCWQAEPTQRPLFRQLEDTLTTMECEWLANGKES